MLPSASGGPTPRSRLASPRSLSTKAARPGTVKAAAPPHRSSASRATPATTTAAAERSAPGNHEQLITDEPRLPSAETGRASPRTAPTRCHAERTRKPRLPPSTLPHPPPESDGVRRRRRHSAWDEYRASARALGSLLQSARRGVSRRQVEAAQPCAWEREHPRRRGRCRRRPRRPPAFQSESALKGDRPCCTIPVCWLTEGLASTGPLAESSPRRKSHRGGLAIVYAPAAGWMFWLTWKTLSGSYCALTRARRS
jgi:hypothetical protein